MHNTLPIPVRPTASHRGVTTAAEHLCSFPHHSHTSMGVPVDPALSSGPALTPPGWCLGLSVPLRPLPILWHAQGRGRGQVEDILRKQRREGVHKAPLGHHPRGATLVVKQRERPVAPRLI